MKQYTVREIESMRLALVHKLWTWQSGLGLQTAKEQAEMQLRTYIEAGIDPNELTAGLPPGLTIVGVNR